MMKVNHQLERTYSLGCFSSLIFAQYLLRS